MRRAGLVAAALAATLPALAHAADTVSRPRPDPARVQASADEFTLVLSRTAIPAGPVVLELVNYGEDDHDLALRRAGGPAKRIAVVRPGERGELDTVLRPGRFVVWCTLADHRARGMRTTLVVRAR